jgi:nicotinamidase-related amidase
MTAAPPSAADPAALRLDPLRAALLVVDVQERLAAAMPEEARRRCERNVLLLLEVARRLALPVAVSEQYPKGLGPTVAPIAAALGTLSVPAARFEKLEFACTDSAAFPEIASKIARDEWIVVGMEAHVCVYQTVRGLRAGGARVHVPEDAVISRTAENVGVGLRLADRTGAIVTSTETVVFDLLQRAGTETFKAISRLVR